MNTPRDRQFKLLLSDDEHRKLHEMADRRGVSAAGLFRQWLNAEAERVADDDVRTMRGVR